MWRLITLDVVFLLVFCSSIGLILYLWLNNSPKTSKRISKLRFRHDPVPENKSENEEEALSPDTVTPSVSTEETKV